MFDSDFSLSKHVQCICRSCFVQLRDFRRVRQYLSTDVSVLVANALISSRLDYCNSLFRSLSKLNLRKLQSIQNCAARIVTNTRKFSSITPVLKRLHWLPVEYRSVFKTSINSFIQVFHSTLTHISSLTVVVTTPGAVKRKESTSPL